jgi:hypothetical protein
VPFNISRREIPTVKTSLMYKGFDDNKNKNTFYDILVEEMINER